MTRSEGRAFLGPILALALAGAGCGGGPTDEAGAVEVSEVRWPGRGVVVLDGAAGRFEPAPDDLATGETPVDPGGTWATDLVADIDPEAPVSSPGDDLADGDGLADEDDPAGALDGKAAPAWRRPPVYPQQLGTEPPGSEWARCLASPLADRPEGLVLNRYLWCLQAQISVVTLSGWPKYGIPIQVVAVGRQNDRSIRIYLRKDPGQAVRYTRPEYLNMRFTARAGCVEGASRCTTAPEGPGRFEITKRLRSWSTDRSWHHWDVRVSTAGALPPELVSRVSFQVEVFDTATGPNGYLPKHPIRCDSATYFFDVISPAPRYSYPHACVFAEVRPHLNYSLSNGDYNEVSRHLQAAWASGANIPGQYTTWANDDEAAALDARALHRVYTEAQARANRRRAQTRCASTLPPRPARGECDEFAFASTEEGGRSTTWDLSVQWVNEDHNRTAGRVLQIWYVRDRILKHQQAEGPGRTATHDDFWVKLVP